MLSLGLFYQKNIFKSGYTSTFYSLNKSLLKISNHVIFFWRNVNHFCGIILWMWITFVSVTGTCFLSIHKIVFCFLLKRIRTTYKYRSDINFIYLLFRNEWFFLLPYRIMAGGFAFLVQNTHKANDNCIDQNYLDLVWLWLLFGYDVIRCHDNLKISCNLNFEINGLDLGWVFGVVASWRS